MKVCLVCSPGGHLSEAFALKEVFSHYDAFIVTYKEEFLNIGSFQGRVYLLNNLLVAQAHRNYFARTLNLLIHMLLVSIRESVIFFKERPQVVMSTGSEIAIPFLYAAKFFHKKTVYVESVCRVRELSGTGRLLYPIADLFLVQWERLAGRYERAQFRGSVLSGRVKYGGKEKKENFIFVTTGTAPFPRLIRKMDGVAKSVGMKVVMQIGKTDYAPMNAEYFRFTSYEKIRRLNKNARVVISHGGIGCIMAALEEGATLIIVPRLKKFGEHYDNHQLEIAEVLDGQDVARVAYDLDEIPHLLNEIEAKEYKGLTGNDQSKDLISFMKDYMSKLN